MQRQLINRRSLAGALLLAMILLCLADGVWPTPTRLAYLLSGICAATAGALLYLDLRGGAKIQVSALFILGGLLLLYAYWQNTSFSLVDAISRNTLLLTMIMSVGVLRLLLDVNPNRDPLPRGRKAFFNTLLGIGVFGSVINISAPLMICDRVAEERPIDLFMAGATSRIFCACSSWSPYFGGAALILTYVQGVRLIEVMSTGLPLLMSSIVGVYLVSLIRHPTKVDDFIGYPMSLPKLWLPASLTASVLIVQALLPELTILVVISLSSLLLTIIVLNMRLGATNGTRSLSRYVVTELPKSANELLLFLSAGVLATGLTAFVESTQFQLNLASYTLEAACLTLASMILVAAIGIHPVIQISALTPLLLPINPDPELLAITYLFAWALGTCASPLAGTHLIIQGRYGIPAWKGAVQNWPFVMIMYFVGIGLMAVHAQVFDI